MNNILLISEELLKTHTPITENVQSSELTFCILQAQSMFLTESLGTKLLNKIYELVDTGDINLPQYIEYKKLVDVYVQPTLIAYAYYIGMDNFAVKWVSIGLNSMRSEQGNPVDFKMFSFLKQNAKNNAEFLNNQLRQYLIFNNAKYPEYSNVSLTNGDIVPVHSKPFTSPLVMRNMAWGGRGNWCNTGLCADSPWPSWYGATPKNP